MIRAGDLKKSRNYDSGLAKLLLGLIYGLSFWIQAASYFPQSWAQKTCLIFYLADFHGRNWCIPGFYENKTQHWALFSTKTNQGRFYFNIGPNSPSRVWDLAAITWHKLSSELSLLNLKAGFKKIRPEPKLLNRRLSIQQLETHLLIPISIYFF